MTSLRGRGERPQRAASERVTFGVAFCLVAILMGVILASWITGPSGPAVLEAGRSGPVTREGTTYRVPFEVHNEGGEAATSVQVVAELTIDGRLEGGGEQVFLFLSGGERETGEFFFGEDPALGSLTIAVASYSRP